MIVLAILLWILGTAYLLGIAFFTMLHFMSGGLESPVIWIFIWPWVLIANWNKE